MHPCWEQIFFFYRLVPGQVVQDGFQNRPASYPPPPARPASTRPAAAGPGLRVPRPAPTPPLGSHGGSAWRTRYASTALTARLERPHPSAASPLLCLLGSRLHQQPAGPGSLDWGVRLRPLPPNLGPSRVSNVDEGVGRGGDEGAPLLGSVETGPPMAPGRPRWPSRPASQPVRFGVHGDPPALWQQGPAASCAPRAWPAPARRQAHGAQRPGGRRGPLGKADPPPETEAEAHGAQGTTPAGRRIPSQKGTAPKNFSEALRVYILKGGDDFPKLSLHLPSLGAALRARACPWPLPSSPSPQRPRGAALPALCPPRPDATSTQGVPEAPQVSPRAPALPALGPPAPAPTAPPLPGTGKCWPRPAVHLPQPLVLSLLAPCPAPSGAAAALPPPLPPPRETGFFLCPLIAGTPETKLGAPAGHREAAASTHGGSWALGAGPATCPRPAPGVSKGRAPARVVPQWTVK